VSKKRVPTEKEVRDFFQRSYYVVPIHGDDGDTVYQADWVGPALPVEEDDD
jgi:hypothetical protein